MPERDSTVAAWVRPHGLVDLRPPIDVTSTRWSFDASRIVRPRMDVEAFSAEFERRLFAEMLSQIRGPCGEFSTHA